MELLRYLPLALLGVLLFRTVWLHGYARGRDDFMAEWRRIEGE